MSLFTKIKEYFQNRRRHKSPHCKKVKIDKWHNVVVIMKELLNVKSCKKEEINNHLNDHYKCLKKQ